MKIAEYKTENYVTFLRDQGCRLAAVQLGGMRLICSNYKQRFVFQHHVKPKVNIEDDDHINSIASSS